MAQVQEIRRNTFAVLGLGHPDIVRVNAGFIVTPSVVVSIDAGMTVADGEFLWQVAHALAPERESLLVLTHHHSDHVFGMRAFRERGAKIIAHARVREFLENDAGRYKAFIIEKYLKDGEHILGDVILSLPDQLIEEDVALNIGGEEIRVMVTPGHVPSELCVYVPRRKVLFAGDAIYEGMRPNTRFAGPVEKAEWVRQLRRLQELDIDVIVPGHGNICGKDEIERNIARLLESDAANE